MCSPGHAVQLIRILPEKKPQQRRKDASEPQNLQMTEIERERSRQVKKSSVKSKDDRRENAGGEKQWCYKKAG